MGVYIKDMEKPKSCDVCDFVCDLNEGDLGIHNYCGFPGIGVYVDDCIATRHKDCPLGDVPTPHGRLIDADALHYSRIRIAHNDGTIGGYNAVVMSAEIKDAPTIIEAEEGD